MTTRDTALARAEAFAASLDLRVPICFGPMAGASPPSLSGRNPLPMWCVRCGTSRERC
jgi:hypothetical protein